MRGWSSIFAGFLLLGVAYWSFSAEGFDASTLLCAAAAAFFLFRGAHGREVDVSNDPSALIDFVRDPADAIVDTATDKISDWFKDDKAEEKFDPDAAVERYIAQRGPDQGGASAAAPPSPAPYRGFGRKGT